ncbi:flavin reductase family protein [Polynucleobacter sinensis]|uniref:flavin reductase family protein n=1 Tax=Polynucleobacter sinensis TaxID=1743157 RepID=UPI000783F46D|nr:flavin reductase family protein [Polynucleobacter sinensis]
MNIDPKKFRQALGSYGTGVAVITTLNAEKKDIGVTVNSFTSVSLDPPLILFSMANTSNSTSAFNISRKFVVNVMANDQESIAMNFARPSAADWSVIHTSISENACAKISGSLAYLECDLDCTYPGGDHTILMGRVTKLDIGIDVPPLLFYKGGFGTYKKNLANQNIFQDLRGFDYFEHGWA